ncbi:hypothetical protein IT568_04265 [bacterium]|nr:hypothetical protein [bacterium]
MQIRISTKVNQNYKAVFSKFDRELFLALNPPFVPVKLIRFDGCEKGCEVHLKIFFIQKWIALIVEKMETEAEIFFIDEGENFPFIFWRHKHRILKRGNEATIVDEINFKTSSVILDCLLFPLLYVQFFYRKPVYKKYFKIN